MKYQLLGAITDSNGQDDCLVYRNDDGTFSTVPLIDLPGGQRVEGDQVFVTPNCPKIDRLIEEEA